MQAENFRRLAELHRYRPRFPVVWQPTPRKPPGRSEQRRKTCAMAAPGSAFASPAKSARRSPSTRSVDVQKHIVCPCHLLENLTQSFRAASTADQAPPLRAVGLRCCAPNRKCGRHRNGARGGSPLGNNRALAPSRGEAARAGRGPRGREGHPDRALRRKGVGLRAKTEMTKTRRHLPAVANRLDSSYAPAEGAVLTVLSRARWQRTPPPLCRTEGNTGNRIPR